ncbi:MAG: LysM peptidoglycan-binding domain-containing protein [Chitinispirillaceae bacterium]|nr:LysM peptidoglycan-binding domain-containing protein [Chitinispirillaceae bacterium]
MTHLRFCSFRVVPVLLITTAGILIVSGCSSSLRKQTILTAEDNTLTIEPIIDTSRIEEPPAFEKDAAEKRFDAMLKLARECCFRSEYGKADSLCRLVFNSVNGGSGDFDSTGNSDDFIEEIIALYAELLPDTFSVPEEIAPQVFHRQLVGSLDTLQFTTKDSAFVAGVFSRSQKAEFSVPVVWNNRVQRALFYYLTRNKATVERWRERSVTYLPFMKKMFTDSGLPADLAYLPLIESGFNAKAYSRAHASGIWQFIGSTGKRYGLRNNYWIDERRDPVLATKAAISYLKKLYGDFGHWHLALAAYNCGENGLARSIRKYGTDDYWQLKLPAETMNYVPLYIASLAIAKSPDFNEVVTGGSDTLPFDTVSVGDCIDLRDIAEGTGIDYDSLRRINPQLLHWCTPPDMSGVQLYLPAGSAEAFHTFYTALPDEKKVKWYRYRIRPGDNLGSIARYFGLPIQGIKSVNRMKGNRIIAGKYLFIPIPVGTKGYENPQEEQPQQTTKAAVTTVEVPEGARLTVYEVKSGDTVWRLAELFGVSARQICGWNKLVNARIKVGQILSIYSIDEEKPVTATAVSSADASGSRPDGQTGRHMVQQGENAFRIGKQYGMTVKELCELNDLDPRNPQIRPGDVLLVTSTMTAASTVAPVARRRNPDGAVAYIVNAGDNLFRIAENFSVPLEQIRRVNHLIRGKAIREGDTLYIPQNVPIVAQTESLPETPEAMVYYTVKTGDNLWRIASNFGISVERLYRYNGLEANAVIMPGDTLRVITRSDM